MTGYHPDNACCSEATHAIRDGFARKVGLALLPSIPWIVFQLVDPDHAIAALPLLRSSVGAAVNLEWDASPEPLVALVDTAGLSSALLNLVINARDAMQTVNRDRRLVLRTRRADGLDPLLQPGEYAVLEVIDNGAGISPELVSRVFEPFFTTKERYHGTGLGLSMVRGFAEQLGGTARIHSTLDVGTTAAIVLPLDAAAQSDAPRRSAFRPTVARSCPGHLSGRILRMMNSAASSAVISSVLTRISGFDGAS